MTSTPINRQTRDHVAAVAQAKITTAGGGEVEDPEAVFRQHHR